MDTKSIRETNFYTAAEVADLLKINHQVLLRKLQSGEISAYKIGRDWRITDQQIWECLEKHANRWTHPLDPRRILDNFLLDGKLKEIPAQRKRRQIILEYILKDFKPGQVYSEKEVNNIITAYHPDFCTIRREFIAFKMMIRSGGIYKVNSGYRRVTNF
jgi:excisionase family DNA binding protein